MQEKRIKGICRINYEKGGFALDAKTGTPNISAGVFYQENSTGKIIINKSKTSLARWAIKHKDIFPIWNKK